MSSPEEARRPALPILTLTIRAAGLGGIGKSYWLSKLADRLQADGFVIRGFPEPHRLVATKRINPEDLCGPGCSSA